MAKSHDVRIYLDLASRHTPKTREIICNIVYDAMLKIDPKFNDKIADIDPMTENLYSLDPETLKQVIRKSSGRALFIEANIQAKGKRVDKLLESVVPIIENDLNAAGFEVIYGWAERLKRTKSRMNPSF